MVTMAAAGSASKLGRLVRERRERVRMTQDELARAAGVGRTTIAAIESGRNKSPAPDILNKIAQSIPVTVAELVKAMGYAIEQDTALLQRAADDDRRLLEEFLRFRRGGDGTTEGA